MYGPAQVHSLVNQDIIISEQFTLWDQEGSEVLLGKMIIEPTAGSLLYIQPVYLQEEGKLKIPQLKRLIMALGDAVVMAPSLEEAAVMLEAELARKSVRRDRNSQTRPPVEMDNRSPADSAAPAAGCGIIAAIPCVGQRRTNTGAARRKRPRRSACVQPEAG